MSIVDDAANAVKTVTGLVGTANGLISKAGSLASASIESVISSLPVSSGSFASITGAMQTVSSITNIVTEGTSQALSKVKQLVGGAGDALANPISFVTKTLKDTVDGFSTAKDLGGTISNAITGMSSSAVSSIASRAGVDVITTSYELSDALVTISDNVYLGTYTAASIIQDTAADAVVASVGIAELIREGIASNIGLAVNTTLGVVNTVDVAVALATGNQSLLTMGAVSKTKNLIATTNTLIPDTEASNISYLDSDLVNTQKQQIATRLNKSLSTLTAEIDYVDDVASSYSKVMSMDSPVYPRFTDVDGNTVDNTLSATSSLSSAELKKFSTTVKKICPTVTIPAVNNYDEMKALFDTALDVALKNGMGTLITSMCETVQYYDSRSAALLVSYIPEVIKSGNISLYKTIVDIVGKGAIADPINDVKILTANMTMNGINLTAFNEILTTLDITADQLVTGNTYGDITAVNTDKVAMLVSSDTMLVDSTLGVDTRNMALQFKIAYTN